MDGQGKRHRQISERFWYRINADQPLKQNPAVIGDDCFWGRTVAKKVKKCCSGRPPVTMAQTSVGQNAERSMIDHTDIERQ